MALSWQKLSAPSKALFDYDWAIMQRESPDLVIYCQTLHIIAKIAWPTVGGHRILPSHMGAYLSREELQWSCFCSVNNSESVSCRIVNICGGGGTFAVCNYKPARCQFFMHLDLIFGSSTRRHPYVSIVEPDSVLARLLVCDVGSSVSDLPLYLPGYLGEKGVQLSMLMVDQVSKEKFFGRYFDADQKDMAVQTFQTDTPGTILSIDESRILDMLVHEEGIEKAEALGMFWPCKKCSKYFVRRFVKEEHENSCTHVPLRRRSLHRPADKEDAARLDLRRLEMQSNGV
ncbi:hypothetical protein B0H19DRAFT_1247794 [Mycena capillaripes]|nr:hypothetical protein B0H19DRAFT_1247794 [Mycena capillaripes]